MPFGSFRSILILVLVNVLLIGGTLCLAEWLLKEAGVIPGNLAPNWSYFQRLDSLECNQQFVVDELGLLKARPEYFEPQGVMINSEGFRGNEFAPDTSDTQSILLIGDSFGWGASADPYDSSFAARLAQAGYTVFNCAIPGTDPAQYAAIAEHYLPKLQPDITLVAFYMGNDIMQERRELEPGKELFYQCMQGWLKATDDGEYFDTPEKAYQHYLDQHTVTENWMFPMRLIAKTRVGTQLIAAPRKVKDYLEWRNMDTPPHSRNYLKQIIEIAHVQGSKPIVAVIPEVRYASVPPTTLRPQLFGDLEVHYMNDLGDADFNPLPDGHFNNRGHSSFASFIVKLIERDDQPSAK